MLALLPGSKKSFPMGCTLRRSIHGVKNLSELSPRSGKSLRGRAPYSVLVRDKDRVQQPVYYCSRALRGAEERYPKMEKLILELVTAARKLRPYFQAHTIEISTEYLMKQVLHKLETSRRLMKWAIELSEFDIRYKPKTSIKGQILEDFVMEFTSAELSKATQLTSDLPIWMLSVDGATNA